MAIIIREQKEYIKAYEALSESGLNVSALIMLTSMSYEEKERLSEYKTIAKLRPEEYSKKIDICYRHLLSTFFKLDNASSIHNNFRDIFNKIYLDNTDDDTNDYTSETMIKLNRIYNFVNSVGDKDLSGTELLSLIRKEVSGEDNGTLSDSYFDIQFDELKKQCDEIKATTEVDSKMELIPELLENIGDLESHLFRKQLFEDDYRKSVTGLVNYLLVRAELPEIYIKPIELDEYYGYVSRVNSIENTEIVTFIKEKICDSIESVVILPMKEVITYCTDKKIRKESGALDNKIYTLKQNKYK